MFLLLAFLGHCHRDEAYDAADLTSIFFNLPHVQANIRAHPNTTYVSCSPQVDAAFGGDVMKSTANLVPDMLAWSHLLLYQGQWDAECGVASNEAWISKLQWWVACEGRERESRVGEVVGSNSCVMWVSCGCKVICQLPLLLF